MILKELSAICQKRLENLFNQYLIDSSQDKYVREKLPATQLQQAMAYSVLNGGKRLRPLLVYATGIALDATLENLDIPAAAVELIHAYSLIHDDLPAMDNADLRRGKPTCHKAFNEGLAILAGDALQPLAFEIIASHPAELSAEQRLDMIKLVSHASGLKGMAGGQALDLAGTDSIIDMYNLKTGALLVASAKLGVIAANIKNPDILNAIENYASCLGLAFQIQDDFLDFVSSETTGKTQGIDEANKKITYLTLYGVEKTQEKINMLFANALQSLDVLKEKGELLRELSHAMKQRKM